jgi:hypothetical protein
MAELAIESHRFVAELQQTDEARAISPYEFLPSWVIYGPVVLYWMLLGIRYRDFSLPSLANPNIPTGGLCGESKAGILDQVEGPTRKCIATYGVFKTGSRDDAIAKGIMSELELTFPIVLKPDVGCKGAGVKLVRDTEHLTRVMATFPRGVTLILQRFIPFEGEAGIFYSREPGDESGRILSLTLKTPPQVIGDGVSTIRELVFAHRRAGQAPHVYLPRLVGRLDEVLQDGEPLTLVFTGNHSKGSAFRDATALVTPILTAKIDCVLRSLPDFHHGRIDVRFESKTALTRGQRFQIIEINGVGSEPIQMWDPGASLFSIYAAQFHFYGAAFRIGHAMRRRGHRSRGAWHMMRHWLAQSRLIMAYPPSD